jgi:hypothetical protein
MRHCATAEATSPSSLRALPRRKRQYYATLYTPAAAAARAETYLGADITNLLPTPFFLLIVNFFYYI